MNKKRIIIIIDIIALILLAMSFVYLNIKKHNELVSDTFKYEGYRFTLLSEYNYGFDMGENGSSVLILYKPDDSLLSMFSIMYVDYDIYAEYTKLEDMLKEYSYNIINTKIENFDNTKVVIMKYSLNDVDGYFAFMKNDDESIFGIDIRNESNASKENMYDNILNTVKILKTATKIK